MSGTTGETSRSKKKKMAPASWGFLTLNYVNSKGYKKISGTTEVTEKYTRLQELQKINSLILPSCGYLVIKHKTKRSSCVH